MSGWFGDYFASLTEGPGMWKWAHYSEIYDRHFAKFAGRDINLLEVGVASGGSLTMWRQYLGGQAHIYGVDNDPRCAAFSGGQIEVFTADQTNRGFWRQFSNRVPQLDVVIDDGGHHFEGQTATLEALLPHIRPGGVYMVEDIYKAANPMHGYLEQLAHRLHEWLPGDPAANPSAPSHALVTNERQRRIDGIHLYPFVAVIEIREELLTTLTAPRRGSEWFTYG